MKLLLLNPNTDGQHDRIDGRRRGSASGLASDRTGAAYGEQGGCALIATRAEAQIGGATALEMLAEHHKQVDAAMHDRCIRANTSTRAPWAISISSPAAARW